MQLTMRATCFYQLILCDMITVQHPVKSTYREAPHYGTLTNPPSFTLCQGTCSSQRELPHSVVPMPNRLWSHYLHETRP
jgi:hypothetical protein